MTYANISRVFFRIRPLDTNADWHEISAKGFRRYGGTLGAQTAEAHTDAKKLANGLQAEVRWNFEGSLQGHYVSPDPLPELHPYERKCNATDDDEVEI